MIDNDLHLILAIVRWRQCHEHLIVHILTTYSHFCLRDLWFFFFKVYHDSCHMKIYANKSMCISHLRCSSIPFFLKKRLLELNRTMSYHVISYSEKMAYDKVYWCRPNSQKWVPMYILYIIQVCYTPIKKLVLILVNNIIVHSIINCMSF